MVLVKVTEYAERNLSKIYITISTFTSVRPSGVGGVSGVPLSIFKFLQSYHKVSLMKVA